MKFAIISTAALVLVSMHSVVGAQEPDSNEKYQIVAVGEVAKVTKVKNSFEIRSATERNQRPNISTSGINLGISLGRRGPNPGTATDPAGNPGRVGEDVDRYERNEFVWTVVYLTDRTACKERDTVILCSALRITDRVRVTGSERPGDRGKGLYATEVVRLSSRD